MDLEIVGEGVRWVFCLEIDRYCIVEVLCQVCESTSNFYNIVADEVTFVVSPSAEIYIALRVGAHHVDRLRSFDAHSRAGGQASLNRKPDSVGGFLARNAIGLGKGKVRYLKGVVHLYCQSRIIVAGNLSPVSRLYDDLWESVRLLQ